ncbi:hypothetical protein BRADI_5g27326v3 [Brachypodium distachyon]|uniref:Uncharacterized protein n=1 Tax=Brachypodium distachyon TaxID=15368 RepID=A0A2K2CJL1_BRADI|nr:hypothetical protein BRADI_5g27326v3 [Brachypodium distachyon]
MSPRRPPDVKETLPSDHASPPALVLDGLAVPSPPMPHPPHNPALVQAVREDAYEYLYLASVPHACSISIPSLNVR